MKERKQMTKVQHKNIDQNDQFYFIAGYTSGGAPYGVTWEEMGLEPWQSLEDLKENNLEVSEDEEDLPFD